MGIPVFTFSRRHHLMNDYLPSPRSVKENVHTYVEASRVSSGHTLSTSVYHVVLCGNEQVHPILVLNGWLTRETKIRFPRYPCGSGPSHLQCNVSTTYWATLSLHPLKYDPWDMS